MEETEAARERQDAWVPYFLLERTSEAFYGSIDWFYRNDGKSI